MLHRIEWLSLFALLASACNNDTALPYIPDRVGASPAGALDLGVAPPDLAARDLATPPDLAPRPDLVVSPDLVMLPGYPAPHPPLPQVRNLGGRVLGAPELTAVVFPNDAFATDLDALINAIGKSTYWQQVASDYGVGPG